MSVVINCPGCNRRIRVPYEPTNTHPNGNGRPEWALPGFICQRCGGNAQVARSVEPHPAVRAALLNDEVGALRLLNEICTSADGSKRAAPRRLYSVRCNGPLSTKTGLAQTLQEALLLGSEFAYEAYLEKPTMKLYTSTVTAPDGHSITVYQDGSTETTVYVDIEDL